MSDELKPCPFCDGTAIGRSEGVGLHSVVCFCVNSPEMRESSEVATSNWNTRPIEDALRAEIAALREVVKAADAMRGEFEVDIITSWQVSDCEMPEDYLSRYDAIHAYDAAREKVTL